VSARHCFLLIQAAWAVFVLLLGATVASAYVGPGPGLELFSVFASLVAWVVIAVGTVLMWPFYTLVRWLRGTPAKKTPTEPVPTSTTEGASNEGGPTQP
jgi:hypothetical protein